MGHLPCVEAGAGMTVEGRSSVKLLEDSVEGKGDRAVVNQLTSHRVRGHGTGRKGNTELGA